MKNIIFFFAMILTLFACNKEDNPVNPNGEVEFFDLYGKLNSYNELDSLGADQSDFKIYLLADGVIKDSTSSIPVAPFHFKNLEKGPAYQIKISNNINYPQFDTIIPKEYSVKTSQEVEEISGKRVYVEKLNYYINLGDINLYQPLKYPKIIDYKASIFKVDTLNPHTLRHDYHIDVNFLMNMVRGNLGVMYSVSRTPSFEQNECLIFNYTEIIADVRSSVFAGGLYNKLLKTELTPNEKLYFKVLPLKNGVIREKDSRELGEPYYFEVVIP